MCIEKKQKLMQLMKEVWLRFGLQLGRKKILDFCRPKHCWKTIEIFFGFLSPYWLYIHYTKKLIELTFFTHFE